MAAWVIVNSCPATANVPTLATPVFAATLNVTAPLPTPLAPDAMVIHALLLVDVQVHPEADATLTVVPAPPAASTDWPVGLIEDEQPAVCVTVNVCPATVSVPVRAALEFVATLKFTVPFPVPFAPDVIVIHEWLA